MIMQYRKADINDVPALAAIRSADWETPAFWQMRIAGYMNAELHPQQALSQRVVFLAAENETVLGFIAGHLTTRFSCDGELQWINVVPAYRRTGMATELLRVLAAWFIEQDAFNICVNAAIDDATGQRFYKRNGAEDLSDHWLVWKDISVVLKK